MWVCSLAVVAETANAVGWPAGYEGVMLQAFYWDSYSDTKWTNLTSQADELAESFDLIWVPNSARASGSPTMGYTPIYWFTNHSSSFGTESQLLTMIETFKEKNVGIIADLVVNHRTGMSNWTNFPTETWNGKTWKLGPEHICCTDEVKDAAGQATPTGAADTGDDFDGGRDLDHTNATVQDNVKNYCLCLLEKYGYVGFRIDMAKGYSGQYTKIYNQYSKPTYSVGEYWDGSYDAVAAWIEATGRESAAFDYPCKYALNNAYADGDLTKLVWKANGTVDQPAGLIHYGYPQLAVTFIDNHDTYRDSNKFTGNVLAANAFILCSPGTPCVFLPHWKSYKSQIKEMIAARKAAGVSNTSAVTVLKSTSTCYLAEVQGSKSKLAVRIGSTSDVPSGYTSDELYCSGSGYAIWVKGSSGGDGNTQDGPITVYYDNSTTAWSKVLIHYWGAEETTWPGIDMTNVEGYIWTATLPEGTVGMVFNDGDGNQTADVLDPQNNHVYKAITATGKPDCSDEGEYNADSSTSMPSSLYVIGDLADTHWDTNTGVQMSLNGSAYVAQNIRFSANTGETNCYFSLTTALASSWDDLNMTADRYGAVAEGTPVAIGTDAVMKLYANGVDASGCQSWAIAPGIYDIVADFSNMTISAATAGSVSAPVIAVGDNEEEEYYNLCGVRVDNPTAGLYIVRKGDKVTKRYIR